MRLPVPLARHRDTDPAALKINNRHSQVRREGRNRRARLERKREARGTMRRVRARLQPEQPWGHCQHPLLARSHHHNVTLDVTHDEGHVTHDEGRHVIEALHRSHLQISSGQTLLKTASQRLNKGARTCQITTCNLLVGC